MQEFGIQIELTMTGHSRTTTSTKERTLHFVLRLRGEIKLTYKTFLLNGETSDTNDNVKTKIQSNINTKHMKLNNDVTQLVET